MAIESATDYPVEIVEALEDMNIEIAMLQQLISALAESADALIQPIICVADKDAH